MQLGELKLLLCTGSKEGPHHKGVMYITLTCISARGCFQGYNPRPPDCITINLPITSRLPFRDKPLALFIFLDDCCFDITYSRGGVLVHVI